MGIGKVSGADVSIVKKFSGSTEFVSISAGTPEEVGTHVFLLAGQSNMVGRPTFDGGTGYPSGTLQYPKATGYPTYTDTTTIAASPPLGHWDAQAGDMGLALQFTIDYVSETGNSVVLIPAAKGGTGFASNNWNPGDAEYEHAVDATNALMTANPDWNFKAILWHQGENDSGNEANYATALYKMIQQMREDITEANQNTPFITGQLLVGGNATTVSNTAVITNTPVYNYQTALVSSASLTSYDNLHFDAASLRTFGSRYEDAFSSLNNPYPTAETGATGHWLFGRGNQLYIDLTGGASNLTENNAAPTYGYNYAQIDGQGDGLDSSITESATVTLCYIVKVGTSSNIIGGTLGPSGTSGGVSLYLSGTSVFFNERGGTGQVLISSITDAFTFVAVSLDASDNYVGYLGDSTAATVVTGTGSGRATSTRTLAVGDVHYNQSGFAGTPQIAEAIFFDSAKSEAELDAIYVRSVTRMSARNITVQ